jgi:hypothetical protein
MHNIRSVPTSRGALLGWIARLSSLVINSAFLLILCLALTNEDKPQGPALTVLALLVLTMAASFAAWRWPRTGGALVVVGGVCLGVAAYAVSLALDLGPAGLLGPFIYGAPFVLLGTLFWISGSKAIDGSVE